MPAISPFPMTPPPPPLSLSLPLCFLLIYSPSSPIYRYHPPFIYVCMSSSHPHPHPHPSPCPSPSPSPSPSLLNSKRQTHSLFRGVRRRSWGRYVSEIRLPGKKTRVWLGSFGSPEMAARAYDAAAFFLKGDSASLNFPESAQSLPRPESASRKDIQLAAAKAASERVARRTDHGVAVRDLSLEDWCGFEVSDEVMPFRGPLPSPLSFESFDCWFDGVTTSYCDQVEVSFSNHVP